MAYSSNLFLDAGTSTCYVDTITGNDTSAMRGLDTRRFKTIQAALTAASAGDTIQIASGTYTENVVMPDKNMIIIQGAGQDSTFITNSGTSDTFSWTPTTTGLDRFEMRDITILNTATAKRGIVLDGTVNTSTVIAVASNGAVLPQGTINVGDTTNFAASGTISVLSSTGINTVTYTGKTPTTFTGCSGGAGTLATGGYAYVSTFTFAGTIFEFERVVVSKTGTGDAVYMRRVSRANANLCTWAGVTTSASTFTNTNITARASIFSALDCEYNDTTPISTSVGREGIFLAGGSTVAPSGIVTLRAHVLFGIDATCIIYGSILGVALSTNAGPAHGPIIVIQGVVGSPLIPGSGALSLTLPINLGTTFIDLSRGQFFANLGFGSAISIVGAASGARNIVGAVGARFAASSASTVTAGEHVDLNAKGATYAPQTIFTVAGTGAVDRDRHVITAIATVVGTTGTISIAPPFPTVGGTSYTISLTPKGATALVDPRLAAGFTATGFAITATAVSTVDAVIHKFA